MQWECCFEKAQLYNDFNHWENNPSQFKKNVWTASVITDVNHPDTGEKSTRSDAHRVLYLAKNHYASNPYNII